FCAMMTNDMANTEKLSEYIAEARAMGIEVLPPDVNESQVYFAPARGKTGISSAATLSSTLSSTLMEPTAGSRKVEEKVEDKVAASHRTGEALVIRFGLAAIKGVGEVAVESILKARNQGGRFPSMAELCERVDGRTMNRKI